jgi:hypothetical protein
METNVCLLIWVTTIEDKIPPNDTFQFLLRVGFCFRFFIFRKTRKGTWCQSRKKKNEVRPWPQFPLSTFLSTICRLVTHGRQRQDAFFSLDLGNRLYIYYILLFLPVVLLVMEKWAWRLPFICIQFYGLSSVCVIMKNFASCSIDLP